VSLGVRLVAAMLLLGFFACCVASALLQLVAWNRHGRAGEGPTVRGVWNPEAFLDPVGVRQMKLARWLLVVGGISFVSHVVVLRLGASFGGDDG
jgi:hypothetical protein